MFFKQLNIITCDKTHTSCNKSTKNTISRNNTSSTNFHKLINGYESKSYFVICDLKHVNNFRHLHHPSNFNNIQFDAKTTLYDIDIYETKEKAKQRLTELNDPEMRMVLCIEKDIYDLTLYFYKMRFNFIA